MPNELEILLVEDSPADVLIIGRALRDGCPRHRMTVLGDGHQALGHLNALRDGADGPRPDVVLLDLNLPGLDGCQILSEIRADPALKTLPVVILTTSDRDEDVRQAYEAGANSVIQKPVDYPGYLHLAEHLGRYWGHVVTLPPFGPAA